MPFHTNFLRRARSDRWLLFLILIAILAFVLRVIYLQELRQSPWIGHEVFYQTPLYPYFLAIIFKLAGHQLIVVRIVQALLGGVSCALLGIAGKLFFDWLDADHIDRDDILLTIPKSRRAS